MMSNQAEERIRDNRQLFLNTVCRKQEAHCVRNVNGAGGQPIAPVLDEAERGDGEGRGERPSPSAHRSDAVEACTLTAAPSAET